MGVSNASFRVGELTAAGLPDASVEAVLCSDAIQFLERATGYAYDEIRRVLKPGGRVVLTCWEPLDRNDERLSPGTPRKPQCRASTRRASWTLRSATARRGWHASTRCGRRPSRLPLATTLRCAPSCGGREVLCRGPPCSAACSPSQPTLNNLLCQATAEDADDGPVTDPGPARRSGRTRRPPHPADPGATAQPPAAAAGPGVTSPPAPSSRTVARGSCRGDGLRSHDRLPGRRSRDGRVRAGSCPACPSGCLFREISPVLVSEAGGEPIAHLSFVLATCGAAARCWWCAVRWRGWTSRLSLFDLPRAFRTADLWLIHAADCCSRYSSWTCCGVRY
mgnify:CR=1 FL=1